MRFLQLINLVNKYLIIMRTKKIYIKGMHCTSCEKLLEDEFGNVAGVKKVKVNYKNGSGEIECEKEVNFSQLVEVAENLGYKIYENEKDIKNDDVVKRNFTTSLEDTSDFSIFLPQSIPRLNAPPDIITLETKSLRFIE